MIFLKKKKKKLSSFFLFQKKLKHNFKPIRFEYCINNSVLLIISFTSFIELTLGRVSTTYKMLEFGFVFRTSCSICSSSMHLALNPLSGCEQRLIDALFGWRYVRAGKRPFDRNLELPSKTVLSAEFGTNS